MTRHPQAPAAWLNADPREQTTAATDLLIALAALRAAAELAGMRRRNPLRAAIWAAMFALLAATGALGAAVHGLALAPLTRARLWRPLNLLLGLVVGLFTAGAIYDTWGPAATRRALPALAASALGLEALSRRLNRGFLVFIVYEAVAMLFALGAYARLAADGRLPGAHLVAAGILVTIIAAGVQTSSLELTIAGVPLDHNGLFHLVQLAGLPPMVAGLRAGMAP